MSTAVAFSATATLVATAFGLLTYERWTLRRRRHDAAWTVALAMFALATAGLWAGLATGWSPWTYRAFYLFGAVLNVPVLALGTLYLLGRRRGVDVAARVLALWCAFAAGVLATTPLRGELPSADLPRAADHLETLPRVLGVVGSSVGALVLVGGAAWSAVGYARGRRAPRGGLRPGDMVLANLLIAIGTIVLGIGGSRFDTPTSFALTTSIGIAVIFSGFLVTQRVQEPARGDRFR